MQVERASTRLHELHISKTTPDVTAHQESSPALLPEIPDEVIARLGGRYAADVAALLKKKPSISRVDSPKQISKPKPKVAQKPANDFDPNIHLFAIKCIKDNNIQGAIDFIKRHVPDQLEWLNAQIQRLAPYYFHKNDEPLFDITIVPDEIDGILVDPEVGRIASALGQFKLFRAWAYALHADDGDGWIDRSELESVWKQIGVANGTRQSRRLIQEGINSGYWSQDKNTNRIYLTGQMKLAQQLIQSAISQQRTELFETNKPGAKRIKVDLSGSIQRASAQLYAAWLVSRDRHDRGVMISRETLCTLWNVSIPTLLKWEHLAKIRKQSNFAQSNETSIDKVPQHAYLTLNRDGTHSTSWRLPNTYSVKNKSIQEHSRTGKARRIRSAISWEIAKAEQRGFIGDTALPRSGKRYFTRDQNKSVLPFKACDNYLRRVGRKGGDLQTRRYFHIGKRHRVNVFEAYNLQANMQETNLHQRVMRQEKSASFEILGEQFRVVLAGGF